MRKLDQLNLDIEEALSASSSPSDTPCTTRKKQVSVHTAGVLTAVLQVKIIPFRVQSVILMKTESVMLKKIMWTAVFEPSRLVLYTFQLSAYYILGHAF